MAAKLTRRPGSGLLYSIRVLAITTLLWPYRVAVVSAAVLSALVNGPRDVFMKRLYILKIVLSHSPFKMPVR